MNFQFQKDGDELTVYLSGKIYYENSTTFKELLMSKIDDSVNKLVVDIKDVNYIDSIGIGILVAIYKKICKRGQLVIKNPNEFYQKFFSMNKLDKLFVIAA